MPAPWIHLTCREPSAEIFEGQATFWSAALERLPLSHPTGLAQLRLHMIPHGRQSLRSRRTRAFRKDRRRLVIGRLPEMRRAPVDPPPKHSTDHHQQRHPYQQPSRTHAGACMADHPMGSAKTEDGRRKTEDGRRKTEDRRFEDGRQESLVRRCSSFSFLVSSVSGSSVISSLSAQQMPVSPHVVPSGEQRQSQCQPHRNRNQPSFRTR